MMPAIRKNLYLVHGWKVADDIRNSMMMEKGVDARELGISLTMAASGKASFVGRHLGTVDIRDGEEFVGIPIPDAQEQQSLQEIAATLKLGVEGPPKLYVIEG
jgi:hypothetical protein